MPAFGPTVAARIARWCAVQGVNLRDVVVLLPYAGLLPPLREAFAGHRGMAAAHRDHTHAVCVAGAGPRRRGRAGQLRSGHRPAERRHDAALTGQPERRGSGAMRAPSMPPSRRWSMPRTRCCAVPMTVRPICAMPTGQPPGRRWRRSAARVPASAGWRAWHSSGRRRPTRRRRTACGNCAPPPGSGCKRAAPMRWSRPCWRGPPRVAHRCSGSTPTHPRRRPSMQRPICRHRGAGCARASRAKRKLPRWPY